MAMLLCLRGCLGTRLQIKAEVNESVLDDLALGIAINSDSLSTYTINEEVRYSFDYIRRSCTHRHRHTHSHSPTQRQTDRPVHT